MCKRINKTRSIFHKKCFFQFETIPSIIYAAASGSCDPFRKNNVRLDAHMYIIKNEQNKVDITQYFQLFIYLFV